LIGNREEKRGTRSTETKTEEKSKERARGQNKGKKEGRIREIKRQKES
jgi:hypothetical protein